MTKSGKLCLRFTDFETSISSIWKSTQEEKYFCDVTLACGSGEQMQAHKVVLSSCSPVLRNLLIQNPHQHPLLYLRGVKYSELVHLLDFIYQGQVDIDQEDLPDFLNVAQELQIKGFILNDLDQTQKIQQEQIPAKGNKKTSNKSSGSVGQESNVTSNVKAENTESFSGDSVGFGQHMMTSPDVMLMEGEYNIGEAFDRVEPTKVNKELEEYGNVGHAMDGYGQEGFLEYLDDDEVQQLSPIKNVDESGKTFYYCKECEYSSKSKGNFTQHIESMHKGRFYPCETCGYKAKHRSNLKKHQMAMHEGVRYPCEFCDYKATQKKYLKVHVTKRHTAPQVNLYLGWNAAKSTKSSRKPRQSKSNK